MRALEVEVILAQAGEKVLALGGQKERRGFVRQGRETSLKEKTE